MEFNPELCQCSLCETKLKSEYEGQFVSCECGQSFVDQTIYYSRYGGEVKSISELILRDLKKITGIGYERDDVLILLAEMLPENAGLYYTVVNPNLGCSFENLVDDGRGHKVIELLEAMLELDK